MLKEDYWPSSHAKETKISFHMATSTNYGERGSGKMMSILEIWCFDIRQGE